MKLSRTVEDHYCDQEGCKESAYLTCIRCGVEYCHKHGEHKGTVYPHSVFFNGSGDGFFCKECDAILVNDPAEPLHRLHEHYRTIQSLRNRMKALSEQIDKEDKKEQAALAYWLTQTKAVRHDRWA